MEFMEEKKINDLENMEQKLSKMKNREKEESLQNEKYFSDL